MLDASAVLALMLGEDGAEAVHDLLPLAHVSSVTLSEVVAKLQERGVPSDLIATSLSELGLDVVPFDEEQARYAGLLRRETRSAGLSLGDRCCFAAAAAIKAIAVTSDRDWLKLADQLDVKIMAIR